MKYDLFETIVASATGNSKGAISIVRLSGKDAITIANKVFKGKREINEFKSHTAHIGYIVDGDVRFEKVLLLVFRAPNSYTGEDIVEFHLHGGKIATEWLIELLVRNGARLAEPGEFTYRAVVNGKIDLIQAESINELVNANSRAALLASIERLDGTLSELFKKVRSDLWDMLVEIEAYLNFPEDEIEINKEKIKGKLLHIKSELTKLCEHYDRVTPLMEGVKVVIAGPKNAGKSSLFNAIVGESRAIVSPLPGTTRDFIEATIELNGNLFTFIDTAGLGEPSDILDIEGQRRAEERINEAHIVIFLVDGSIEQDIQEKYLNEKTILVANKLDIGIAPRTKIIVDKYQGLYISALKKTGIKELIEKVAQKVNPYEFDKPILGNLRQRNLTATMAHSIEKAAAYIDNHEELACEELNLALESVDEILGFTLKPNILDDIFSKFCIGK